MTRELQAGLPVPAAFYPIGAVMEPEQRKFHLRHLAFGVFVLVIAIMVLAYSVHRGP